MSGREEEMEKKEEKMSTRTVLDDIIVEPIVPYTPPPSPETAAETEELPKEKEEEEEEEVKLVRTGRRVCLFPLQMQMDLLDNERDIALTNTTLIRRALRRGFVAIEDLNVNLMPVINHQKRTNQSLDRIMKRVFRHHEETDHFDPRTIVIDPTRDVDEVDHIVVDMVSSKRVREVEETTQSNE